MRILTLLLLAAIFILTPSSVSASSGLLIPTQAVSGFSITSLGEFVGAITQLLFIIAGVLVFVYLVWGGIQWLTSGGDSGATQSARDRITAALIGLAIIAIAYAITILVQAFFGVKVFGTSSIPKPFGVVDTSYCELDPTLCP